MDDDADKNTVVRRRNRAKNRPKESKWRQQQLPGYRPVLTAPCALPITVVLGFIMTAIGALLYVGATNSLETIVDYTSCRSLRTGMNAEEELMNATHVDSPLVMCEYNVPLEENYTGEVKFYYGLDGFYQNTRLYVNSRSELQLYGDLKQLGDCKEPLAMRPDEHGVMRPIAPCGFIADSMFNDTFTLYQGGRLVPFTASGIISNYLRSRKFRNPKREGNESLCDAFKGTVRPPSWRHDACQLGSTFGNEAEANLAGRGFENVDFIVWMKPAALPMFRKIYRFLDRNTDDFANGLKAGNYTLKITYNYPTKAWKGKKKFVIAAETWAGGRNLFLAIAFLVVGVFLLLVSLLFLVLCLRLRYLERRAEPALS